MLSYQLSGGHGHGEPRLLLSHLAHGFISRCKITSSLLSSRPSPSALGQEELHVFHTAPPLTSAGTWKHAPSPATFYITKILRHKALLRFSFRFLLARVSSTLSRKWGGSHAPCCPAQPHCPALLPNAPHPKSPRFPSHLPVSTCRAPTATPTPPGGASPAALLQAGAAGAGEPRPGKAHGALRRHRAGPGTARRGGGLASPHPPLPPGGRAGTVRRVPPLLCSARQALRVRNCSPKHNRRLTAP